MAKLTITVEMGNAAFEDWGSMPELRRILNKVEDQIEAGYTTAPIRDINGNICGRWLLQMDEE